MPTAVPDILVLDKCGAFALLVMYDTQLNDYVQD